MTRFFFNVYDGQSYIDREGTELPSIDAARNHAAKYAGELLRDAPARFWTGDEWKMEVADDRGLILFCLMFVAIDAPSIMSQANDSRSKN